MKPSVSDYWANRETWPLEPRDWVVFGRAIDQLGPLIAAGWEGDELGALGNQILPPWPSIKQPDKFLMNRALTVLLHHGPTSPEARAMFIEVRVSKAPPPIPRPSLASPDYARAAWKPPATPTPATTQPDLPSVKEAYDKARELNQTCEQVLAEWAARAAVVKRRIAQACLQEELVTGYRSDKDGAMRTISTNWWNTEKTDTRFFTGKIDRLNPLVPPNSYTVPTDWSYLYITRASLDAFAARLAPVATIANETAAKRQLLATCEAFFNRGEGSVPVGAVWKEASQAEFGMGPTAAKRVWSQAAALFPKLAERAGKPKRPSAH